MLPIVDKPLIQYAVEEALEAGIESLPGHLYSGRANLKMARGELVEIGDFSDAGGSGTSELGLRIAAALREHGMVDHTVWMEEKG